MREDSNREISSKEEKDYILRLAKQEGKIFKKGASGKYQKTPLTRIGFILVGLPFLSCFLISYKMVESLRLAPNFGRGLLIGLSAIGMFAFGLIGVVLLRHAIKK